VSKEQLEHDRRNRRNRKAAEAVLKNPERYPRALLDWARAYMTTVYVEEKRQFRNSTKPRLQMDLKIADLDAPTKVSR
jgi:hypothetical protein